MPLPLLLPVLPLPMLLPPLLLRLLLPPMLPAAVRLEQQTFGKNLFCPARPDPIQGREERRQKTQR